MISRRDVLVLSAAALAAANLRSPALAQDAPAERHGISAFGDLAYPPEFKHFAYVNPDAPKGGTF
jgi:microcin C transport system substrate-binding protein